MLDPTPTIVLVDGAAARPASWSPVVLQLRSRGLRVVAAVHAARRLADDAARLRGVVGGLGGPVVLAGHSYGGMVITEAAARNAAVLALVYVAGYAPDQGESALGLSPGLPGRRRADALSDGLPTGAPAWQDRPSWFVYGDRDQIIPVEVHRFMAERADAEVAREMAGASHALALCEPEAVTATILEAAASC